MTKRIYFGTDGVRGRVGSEVINPEFALRLGYAAGCVFATHDTGMGRSRPIVMIGKDTRISGYMLESALQAGLSAAGVDVLLAGPMPTPAVAYLTRALRLSAGIVISASHNPYHDNGIKFFSASGKKLADDTELAIEALLDQPIKCVESEHLGRAQRIKDAAGRYIEFCKSSFPSDLSLRGLKIVVDAAHGAAYDIAHHVFEELGAEVVAVGVKPDGFNINHQVGTEHLEHLVEQVLAHKADLGVALDGDADRLRMVDQQGRIYNGDELLYAMVKARLGAGGVAGVVGTLMTNFALEKRLKELGVGFARAGVGDRYVLELLEQKQWLLGGESSGHLICLDKHSTGDGIIAALQVLAAMQRLNKSLVDLLSDLVLFPQTLINVAWDKGDVWKTYEPLISAQKSVEQELGNTGRVLIRASGTEPKLRVMVEAMDPNLARNSAEVLVKALS